MTIVRPGDGSGWQTIRTVGEASVAITSSAPRSGQASLEFVQDGTGALADYGLFWTDPGRTLGRLSDLAFDWQVASDGTAPDNLAPAFRLHYDADADLATPEDQGALIWEWKYNGDAAVPDDAWQQADITDDHFWMFKHQPGEAVLEHDITLAAWTAGSEGVDPTFEPDLLSAASLVTGVELASGNGWPGSFHGFVDNVRIAFGDDLVFANFELTLPSLFTTADDRVDLNEFDLAAHGGLDQALAGDDLVRLSEVGNLGLRFDAGPGNDKVYGSASGDLIDGGDGHDHLLGLNGDDRLDGGTGDDFMRGGRGYDALFGGAGNDLLKGDQGHDLLDGGSGDDVLLGGGSQDVFLIAGADTGDDRILDFRNGFDVVRLDAVLAPEGGEIAGFADVDDHPDGRLDALDTNLSVDDGALTWHFDGGSLTLEGVLALAPENVVFA